MDEFVLSIAVFASFRGAARTNGEEDQRNVLLSWARSLSATGVAVECVDALPPIM